MWYDACLKAPLVRETEVLDLEPIVKELQTNYATQFDKENKEHVQLLRRLWEAASLGEDPEKGHISFEIQSSQWQTIGFQVGCFCFSVCLFVCFTDFFFLVVER